MTTQNPATTTVTETEVVANQSTAGGDGETTNAHLREAHAKALERANAADARYLDRVLKDVGVDPKKKLGESVKDSFEGDWEDTDALRAHLTDEYDFTAPTAETSRVADVEATQGRTRDLAAASSSAAQPDQQAEHDAKLAEARERGREGVKDSIALQSTALVEAMVEAGEL